MVGRGPGRAAASGSVSISDARVLWHLLRGQPRTGDHASRLAAFYGPQAADYDRFRERLLQGRRELIDQMDIAAGSSVVELGCGTGRNVEFLGGRLSTLARVELVDLCAPLLERARLRAAGWPNVHVIAGDATSHAPADAVDAVYCSYSLSMIPDWFDAIDNALRMLRPGGVVGVVDFHVSRRDPVAGRVRHGAATRAFWRTWFERDGVFPSPDHLPYLSRRFDPVVIRESSASVPYLPGVRVPWYLFVGRKA